MNDFAILAPVPLEHLESGQVVAAKTGFVAYGSRKFELFRDIEKRRDGNPVLVLIYASDDPAKLIYASDDPAKPAPMVSWVGRYIGSEDACDGDRDGEHPLGMKHRPPSTRCDNEGHWTVFWHVEKLSRLAAKDCFEISELQTTKGVWRKDAHPRGPELVDVPPFVEFPE